MNTNKTDKYISVNIDFCPIPICCAIIKPNKRVYVPERMRK